MAHVSFVCIELRGPMPGASWIEMSTQTSATPVYEMLDVAHIVNFIYNSCTKVGATKL